MESLTSKRRHFSINCVWIQKLAKIRLKQVWQNIQRKLGMRSIQEQKTTSLLKRIKNRNEITKICRSFRKCEKNGSRWKHRILMELEGKVPKRTISLSLSDSWDMLKCLSFQEPMSKAGLFLLPTSAGFAKIGSTFWYFMNDRSIHKTKHSSASRSTSSRNSMQGFSQETKATKHSSDHLQRSQLHSTGVLSGAAPPWAQLSSLQLVSMTTQTSFLTRSM